MVFLSVALETVLDVSSIEVPERRRKKIE